jgi:tripeptidyl-peptidase-1
LIGLLNDARFKAGLSSVGFLNPWLYESGNSFLIDITAGAGRGCDGTNHQNGKKIEGGGVIKGAFWNATVGWDPVTGLGIPDFQKMVAASIKSETEEEDDD